MTPEFERLVQEYADGTLDEAGEARLNEWVKADPENARAFARFFEFHDRLRDVVRLDADARPIATRRRRVPVFAVAGGLVSLAACVLLLVWIAPSRPAAAAELDRLIARAARLADRTYLIRSLDEEPERWDERRPPVDGATLYVGQPDRYVLIRKYPDGRRFVTGSDGERGWAVPPDGAVRVSADPLRFRGALPGNQQGIPFVDLRSDLVQLRDAYDIKVLPSDAQGRHGLSAVKKSAEYRGARSVELRYDPASGVIRSLIFEGMPRARGGPDRLSVDLVQERDLGPDFFDHATHHAMDRRVVEED